MTDLRIHITEAEILAIVKAKIERSIQGPIHINHVLLDLSYRGHEFLDLEPQIECMQRAVPTDGIFVTLGLGAPHEPTLSWVARATPTLNTEIKE